MSTLYGTLISHAARDYKPQTSALNANTDLINRFGAETKALDLTPHVNVEGSEAVKLVAVSTRGRDNAPLFDALRKLGYKVGEPVPAPQQFTDGFVMWTVSITGRTLSFALLYYVPQVQA